MSDGIKANVLISVPLISWKYASPKGVCGLCSNRNTTQAHISLRIWNKTTEYDDIFNSFEKEVVISNESLVNKPKKSYINRERPMGRQVPKLMMDGNLLCSSVILLLSDHPEGYSKEISHMTTYCKFTGYICGIFVRVCRWCINRTLVSCLLV